MKADYKIQYNESIEKSDLFWKDISKRISWYNSFDRVSEIDYLNANIKWFENGKLNASYNCIDRHVENGFGNKIAIKWEGNNPENNKEYSYNELLSEVSKFSNGLKSLGVKKGDRVCIYMQMIPELAIAMLACARIGAIHSIVFGAFSSDSLSERINDSKCKFLITQNYGVRGLKKNIPMKINADKALTNCDSIEKVIVVRRTNDNISMLKNRDLWWDEVTDNQSDLCPP